MTARVLTDVDVLFALCVCQSWLCVFWYSHDKALWAWHMQIFDTLDNFLTLHTYA